MIARTIHCIGRVQGVFFRASTKDQAQSLNLSGWVKNQADGSVLIHAEGREEAIEKLIDWCKIGPDRAIVDKVKVLDSEIEGFTSFDIMR
ncbi:MAG: acylphosphatase [Bacteroidota bacterium]